MEHEISEASNTITFDARVETLMPETLDVVWYAAGGQQEDNIQV